MKTHPFGVRGFTLVELLVAITIISILSLIVFASLEESRQKARDTARASDIQQLAAALQVYAATYGRYPSSGDGTCSGADSFASGGCLQALVTAGLYSELPVDPVNAGSHVYHYDNTCVSPSGSGNNRYRAWTIGEREQNAAIGGWTDSKTIGVTSCADPQ